MKHNTPSKTAQYMALYRAMETRRPENRRLFTDPYAACFLDGRLRLVSYAAGFPFAERWLYNAIQRRIPGALAAGLARTRLIDDWLQLTTAQQIIVLGAGFDTRSLRLKGLQHLPFIEIDHPDTSRRKLHVLTHRLGKLPENTRYLSIDFNHQRLEDLLDQQGVDIGIPTVLIWEGVTNYLQQAAVDAVFDLTARMAKGSTIIFTYIDKKVLEEPAIFFGAQRLLKDLDEIEERWTFGFHPDELPAYLAARKIRLVKDLGAADYRDKYLSGRKNILKGYEFYRVAMATV